MVRVEVLEFEWVGVQERLAALMVRSGRETLRAAGLLRVRVRREPLRAREVRLKNCWKE
jgi:hypothetical protein